MRIQPQESTRRLTMIAHGIILAACLFWAFIATVLTGILVLLGAHLEEISGCWWAPYLATLILWFLLCILVMYFRPKDTVSQSDTSRGPQ